MVLVLAVHTVESVTAKVPFAVILLQDFISNKKVPAEFKCRQMVPSSGSRSTSLWDTSSPDGPDLLLEWLTTNINVDCKHEVFEVQEEFAVGLGEIVRQRAAERALAGTKEAANKTVEAVGQAAHTVDSKLKISERTSHVVEVVKESQITKSTTAALTKAGTTVKDGTRRVMENEHVAAASQAVGASFRRLGNTMGSAFGSFTKRSKDREVEDGGLTPSFVQDSPHDQPFRLPNSGDAPAPAAARTASPGASVVAPSQQSGPTFTLDG